VIHQSAQQQVYSSPMFEPTIWREKWIKIVPLLFRTETTFRLEAASFEVR